MSMRIRKAIHKFIVLVVVAIPFQGIGQFDTPPEQYFDPGIWQTPVQTNYNLEWDGKKKDNPPRDSVILRGRYIVSRTPKGVDTIVMAFKGETTAVIDTFLTDEILKEAYYRNDSLIAFKDCWLSRDTSGHYRIRVICQQNYMAEFYKNGLIKVVYECYDSLWQRGINAAGYCKAKNILVYQDRFGNPIDFGTLRDGQGTLKYYDEEDGHLYQILTLKRGEKHGTATSYLRDGSLSTVVEFENNKAIRSYFYDRTGTKVRRVISK